MFYIGIGFNGAETSCGICANSRHPTDLTSRKHADGLSQMEYDVDHTTRLPAIFISCGKYFATSPNLGTVELELACNRGSCGEICFHLKRFPLISLDCKLVPVQP